MEADPRQCTGNHGRLHADPDGGLQARRCTLADLDGGLFGRFWVMDGGGLIQARQGLIQSQYQ